MRFANPSKKSKTIATTKGHCVEFPGKGSVAAADAYVDKKHPERSTIVANDGLVFVYVPHTVQNEVLQHGLLPETELEEEAEAMKPVKPEDSAKLKDDLYRAFDRLVIASEREDFAGTGLPKPAAVSRETGYPVTSSEIKEYWQQYSAEGGQNRE